MNTCETTVPTGPCKLSFDEVIARTHLSMLLLFIKKLNILYNIVVITYAEGWRRCPPLEFIKPRIGRDLLAVCMPRWKVLRVAAPMTDSRDMNALDLYLLSLLSLVVELTVDGSSFDESSLLVSSVWLSSSLLDFSFETSTLARLSSISGSSLSLASFIISKE